MALTTTRFNQSTRITNLIDASIINIDSDITYIGVLYSLSQSSTFQTPIGNPTDGQPLQIRITSLLPRTISFDSGYQSSSNNTLPTITTGSSKEDYFFFIYNANNNKWKYINSSVVISSSGVSGANTQVQFNDGGVLGATSGLAFAKATNALSVTGSVIVPILAAASSGNANLILQATGNGTIQAQVADSTATGGNARGTYSVDLQKSRAGATQVASGSYSFVSGFGNTTSGSYSSALGYGNTASNTASFAFGNNNTASGTRCFAFGENNTANGDYSFAIGGFSFARLQSQFALGSQIFTSLGKCQYDIFSLGTSTPDATPKILTFDGTNQITLQNNSAMRFNIMVIATVTGGGNTSGWELKGVIKRGANAASTALVGAVTTTLIAQDAGASGWAIAATANTTTGGLTITATGQAATTIRWVATVECAEVAF